MVKDNKTWMSMSCVVIARLKGLSSLIPGKFPCIPGSASQKQCRPTRLYFLLHPDNQGLNIFHIVSKGV